MTTGAPPSLEVRAGGTIVGPGEARAVSLTLPGRSGHAVARDALPALVVVGARPGPRVVVLAAPRGFETTAARAAAALGQRLRPDEIAGCVVVVPVLRPGGRFAGGGRPVRRDRQWTFPGDPAGGRAARDAAVVARELLAGASLILMLSEPNPTRTGALAIRCDLDDPRARRLAVRAGAPAIVHTQTHARASRRVRAQDAGAPPLGEAIRLDIWLPATGPDGDQLAGDLLDRLLVLEGVWTRRGAAAERTSSATQRSMLFRRVTPVLGPTSGLVAAAVAPGDFVEKGAVLARVTAPVTGDSKVIVAPHDGLVLEGPARAGTRPGAKVFVIARALRSPAAKAASRSAPGSGLPAVAGKTSPSALPAAPGLVPTAARTSRGLVGPPDSSELPRLHAQANGAGGATAPNGATESRPTAAVRVGWVERVSLPQLGIKRLLAKIDTGARTSALHVSRIKIVDPGGAHRRPTLEISIPRGARKTAVAARVVQVHVRDYVQVKGTSGRSERRPVIETTLRLGPLERRIRVTLTDRADMVYPMLVGRTALGVGIVVDPSGRRLWR